MCFKKINLINGHQLTKKQEVHLNIRINLQKVINLNSKTETG